MTAVWAGIGVLWGRELMDIPVENQNVYKTKQFQPNFTYLKLHYNKGFFRQVIVRLTSVLKMA